ncbi:Bug family tripartite tricarboxylate transporter substrate binding protein [Advenella kashmirensis]|nr:tripartite tricarboxylate transporter substrate binding protein [Advenella kashmirensis]
MSKYTMCRNRLFTGAATLLIAGAMHPAFAADYPAKPITFINPYAAGGPADILARIVAKQMSDELGQSIIIQSKPGGGASIGAEYVARAKPDGYTVLFGTAAAHIVTPLMQKVQYDGIKDFTFVGMVGNIPNVLTVAADTNLKSVDELISDSKKNPEKYSYASAGNGSSPHLTGENFKQKTQAKLLHVPYKGAAPASTDLAGGLVKVGFLNLPAVLPFIKEGKLHALAIAANKRSPALPDVPTMDELGYDGFKGSSWYSMAVPANTPKEVVDTLYAALKKVSENPETVKLYEKQGVEAFLMDSKAASEFVAQDRERIEKLLKAANITNK